MAGKVKRPPIAGSGKVITRATRKHIKDKTKTLLLSEVVGKGYAEFWNTKKRYVVCKGSRASKKSKTAALWHIVNIMEHPGANALVIRKTERTLRDSCYADLKWAINRLEVSNCWRATLSPLELIYMPTNQRILFRGMDDPLKLTSISTESGSICFVWIEEAYEITKEEDFDFIDESIRGEMPEGLWKRITLTFNPWNENWIKRRFFDNPDDDVLAMTTTYKVNEFLDDADIKLFEKMKVTNPRRYNVAALGNWGQVDDIVFDNFMEKWFDINEIKNMDGAKVCFGLDFGYQQDPTALFCGIIFEEEKLLYVFDELYEKKLSNEKIAERIFKMGYAKEKITADAAEPKSIDRLYDLGIRRIKAARKGKDSIMNGIDYLQDFKIIIHPLCVNFLLEIQNYSWQTDKSGKKINKPIDDFNHLMDAMRYAVEDMIKGVSFSFS